MSTNNQVIEVPTNSIEKNRDNPRMLFDISDMKELEESISLRGILVPLIVFRKSENKDKFVLLDGERRLKCAKKLDLDKIPVNVIATPSRTENIIRMFNIHNVRKGWELVPTAYSLERLIELLEKEGKKTTNGELSKLTGMSSARVGECKRILKYKKYHHLSLNPNPEKRIGGDFFSQMDLALDKLKTFPEIMNAYSEKTLVKIMINKKLDGTIENMLVDFRLLKRMLSSEKKGVQRNRIIENVRKYFESTPSPQKDNKGKPSQPAISMKEVYDKTASVAFNETEIIKSAESLENLLKKTKYSKVTNKQQLKVVLTSLKLTIENMLKNRN